jgi:RimJ/RimL family protein N-acetyltransferase
LYKEKAVGVHLINQIIPNESGVFHAHIWEKELRGQGIATKTYPMACKVFFDSFCFQRIIFKTPINNLGAIRVKEKLGLKILGEEVLIGKGIVKDGTRVKVFEMRPEFVC